MKYHDIIYDEERDIALGQELESGQYYLSIPVANSRIEYEERYVLTP